MAEEKNIKNYSAADIEKYWSGNLSGKEMHDLEKAAMDDPFLADALEGYQYSSSPEAELNILKEKIESRSGTLAPVINFKKKKYPWLRVAAAIIIITGAGLLAQQLLFKNSGEQALSERKKIENKILTPEAVNKAQVNTDSLAKVPVIDGSTTDTVKFKTTEVNAVVGNISTTLAADTTRSTYWTGDVKDQVKEVKDGASITAPIAKTDDREKEPLKEEKKDAFFEKDRDGIADSLNANYKKTSPLAKQKSVQGVVNDKYSNNFASLDNRYNYRVVDAQNNPVPFAKVMNTRDNVGTYTDIRGNFNLVSSDSILDVQVRSLGYNASNFKLVPSKQAGDIVLKEDDIARKQILADNRKVVSSSVTRKDSANYEEPEVGWGYYNTYVANNFQVPEAALTKNRGNEVELKFDIDKNGQPINIKITRSSQCKECDEEAIRLLKEGPKWKRKGRKSKGSVTIAVDK